MGDISFLSVISDELNAMISELSAVMVPLTSRGLLISTFAPAELITRFPDEVLIFDDNKVPVTVIPSVVACALVAPLVSTNLV